MCCTASATLCAILRRNSRRFVKAIEGLFPRTCSRSARRQWMKRQASLKSKPEPAARWHRRNGTPEPNASSTENSARQSVDQCPKTSRVLRIKYTVTGIFATTYSSQPPPTPGGCSLAACCPITPISSIRSPAPHISTCRSPKRWHSKPRCATLSLAISSRASSAKSLAACQKPPSVSCDNDSILREPIFVLRARNRLDWP